MKCTIMNKDSITKEIKEEIVNFRSEVMGQEYSIERDQWNSYDVESYHFLVHIDQKLVGYYRVRVLNIKEYDNILSTNASSLFDLSKFYQCIYGEKIAELSRAAIHIDYRNGVAISLLWLHLSKFFQDKEISMAIGCTSLSAWSHETYSYIFHKKLVLDLPVLPLTVPSLIDNWNILDEDHIKKKSVQTLIRAYGKQGALFCPFPSYDHEWQTFDFFTVFKTNKMKQRFKNA